MRARSSGSPGQAWRCGCARRPPARRPGSARRRARRAAAPQHRTDPGRDLVGPERLDDVVVGAAVERLDHRRVVVLRGDHDDRHLGWRPGSSRSASARRRRAARGRAAPPRGASRSTCSSPASPVAAVATACPRSRSPRWTAAGSPRRPRPPGCWSCPHATPGAQRPGPTRWESGAMSRRSAVLAVPGLGGGGRRGVRRTWGVINAARTAGARRRPAAGEMAVHVRGASVRAGHPDGPRPVPSQQRTWEGSAGSVTVRCSGQGASLQSASPDDGYGVEVRLTRPGGGRGHLQGRRARGAGQGDVRSGHAPVLHPEQRADGRRRLSG